MSIRNFIKENYKKKFVKNFFTLFSGSVTGQLILFAFIPLLTRLYSEELFAVLFIFSSFTSILKIIASLRFELSIVLPEDDKHAINLLVVAFIINIIINLFFFVLIVLFYDIITNISGENNIGNWFYYIPLSSFFLGFFEIMSYWNNRTEHYKKISSGKITKSAVIVGSQTSLKYFSTSGNGLIAGALIGQAFSAFLLFFISIKSIKNNIKYVSIKNSRALVKKYKDVPLYNTLLSGLNTLSNQIPFLLLGKYFGLEVVAFYGMAGKVIMTPTGMVAQSVGQVFYKTATDIKNKNGDLYGFVKKTYLNLAKLIILPVIIIFISTFFFDFFFGKDWGKAGLYAAVMLPWISIAFLNRPVSWIITILNKQKFVSIFDFLLLIFRFLSIYLSYKLLFNGVFAVTMYSLTGFLFGIFMLFWLLRMSKKSENAY
ncbi:MAG: O-antigen translocase [Bacteroidetes bacterium]|nr:MAG: O-antigen translocase [Bacteroidota bacterium]